VTQPAASAEAATERRVGDTSTRPRRDVYAELLVTVGLFAIPATLNAVYVYVASKLRYGTVGIGWLFASKAAQEVLLIGLFFYVLRANGERLADFTKPARWGDVPRAVGLLLASWLPYVLVMAALWWWTPLLHRGRTNMELFRSRLSVPYLAWLLVNPFCEELWMRAFLQTRLGQLGWRAPLIVLTSASAQAGYHLYQGIAFVAAYAVVFAVLAVYYQRARRVWPVVGVHLIADLSAGIAYSTLR